MKRAADAKPPAPAPRRSRAERERAAAGIFRRLRALNPRPTTELEWTTPFELLVAVMLSAQATDVGVNKATRKLYAVANTPQAILGLGEGGVKNYISTIGLFNAKAKNLIATCRLLLELHGGDVPRTREALEALPGVGRKTANVVLNVAFGELTIAVDTHVFRVSNRTGLAPGKDPLEVEARLMKVTPKKYLRNAHHYLILHGRYTCVAKKPLCWKCPVYEQCGFREKKKFAAMGPDSKPSSPRRRGSSLPKPR